jgi:formate--tetrahydrofolate ligase
MKSDIEIAQSIEMLPIETIAEKLEISKEYIEQYGKYKAKIDNSLFDLLLQKENGKLILVTAINPTPYGEGKTTMSIGINEALNELNMKSIVVLREPSLGPVFGLKGGATGGGYSQVVPMEDINLHFTGDMHAITSANNLLCAMIDNHIKHGNELDINLNTIVFKRCMDMNDRALRDIEVALGGKINGTPRKDGFNITVASEIMAVLCLANDLGDLKNKINNILIGYSNNGNPVFVENIGCAGAMTALLKEAIKPNLVQTLEGNPAIIHGGPFANIAHGCNSIIATKLALKLSDYVVTEAGFGSDLGALKFLDIKCRYANLNPDVIVIVCTTRALKYNAEINKDDVKKPNIDALKKGIVNLQRHIENMKKFNNNVIVCLNKFVDDQDNEIDFIRQYCKHLECEFDISEAYAKGGKGALDIAKKIVNFSSNKSKLVELYDVNETIENKISKVCKNMYQAANIVYSDKALESINEIENIGLDKLPICIAKTQYSLSDDSNKLGSPKDFEMEVKDVRVSSGAGFIIILMGDIMTMPGLPKKPAALGIDVVEENIGHQKKYKITGLF